MWTSNRGIVDAFLSFELSPRRHFRWQKTPWTAYCYREPGWFVITRSYVQNWKLTLLPHFFQNKNELTLFYCVVLNINTKTPRWNVVPAGVIPWKYNYNLNIGNHQNGKVIEYEFTQCRSKMIFVLFCLAEILQVFSVWFNSFKK